MAFRILFMITNMPLVFGGNSIFYYDYYFTNYFCSSSVTEVEGVVKTPIHCARICGRTTGCMSFFHNSVESKCYTSGSILLSILGCSQKAGMVYYTTQKQTDDGCYRFTTDDISYINNGISEPDQCDSYAFHKYTSGDNYGFSNCEDCGCCQRKGCYTGSHYSYNNTWSYSKTGLKCQRRDAQSPHSHTRNNPTMFPEDASVSAAHNYCRDPDQWGQLWCYTEDTAVRFEACGIPQCDQ